MSYGGDGSASVGPEDPREALHKPSLKNEYLPGSVLLIPFFELSWRFPCTTSVKDTAVTLYCVILLHLIPSTMPDNKLLKETS